MKQPEATPHHRVLVDWRTNGAYGRVVMLLEPTTKQHTLVCIPNPHGKAHSQTVRTGNLKSLENFKGVIVETLPCQR